MAVKPNQVGAQKRADEFPTTLDELEFWLDRQLQERTDAEQFTREASIFHGRRESHARRELPRYWQYQISFPATIRIEHKDKSSLLDRYRAAGWDNVEIWDCTDGTQSVVFMKNDPNFVDRVYGQ